MRPFNKTHQFKISPFDVKSATNTLFIVLDIGLTRDVPPCSASLFTKTRNVFAKLVTTLIIVADHLERTRVDALRRAGREELFKEKVGKTRKQRRSADERDVEERVFGFYFD